MLQIPAQKLKEILSEEGLITPAAFDNLLSESSRMEQNLSDVLISRGVVNVEYFYDLLAKYFSIERINFSMHPIKEDVLKKFPENLARQKRIIVFDEDQDAFYVAMVDPTDLEVIEFLKRRLGKNIKAYLASDNDLDKGFAIYGRQFTQDFKQLIEENIRASLAQKADSVEEAAKAVPIVSLIDNLLSYSVSLRSSDLHIEIFDDGILVRFRIDGVLQEIVKIPKEVHSPMVARVKLLASMKIDEHQKPQDGRFRQKIGSDLVDIRVSIIPTFYGEKIEMRLLLAAQKPLSLRELGVNENMVKILEDNIKKTYGMILITGPTGSGKTTTLYSILNILNRPEINIVTIEDPIEYDMKYVNQTQVNILAGVTFANGLRSILRQDPNIIMVGEIRDEETAEIGVHAALTGHLLLSSLHTNDAVTAIPRLIDMKIAPFLVAAVLNMVLAQRLVRKICLNCIESYPPPADLLEYLQKQVAGLNLVFDFKMPKILYRGKGCSACGNTGYSGRIGIYEVLNVDEDVRKEIISQHFSLDNVISLAKKKGMITMFEDGLQKAELGMTTIEEVLRVIRE